MRSRLLTESSTFRGGIAMSSTDPLARIEDAFRKYLEDSMKPCFELRKGQAFFVSQSLDEMSGSIVAAFDALAHPEGNTKAKKFIDAYNEICVDLFHGEWNGVTSLQYTYVYKPASRDIMFCVAATAVIKEMFADQYPVVLQVLESERNVLYLHFHQFLENVWRKKAAHKAQPSRERCHTGIFGRTRFSTWSGIGAISFQFSDINDDSRSVSFSSESLAGDNSGYNAVLSSCYVDIITALEMIREVTENFDPNLFRATSEYTWYLWSYASAQ